MNRKIGRKIAFAVTMGLVLTLACGEDPDGSPPEVEITAPVNGQMISADVMIEATASDNEGVAKVGISVDDVILVEIESPPYEYLWEIASYADGEAHRIQAAATDTAGNMTLSDYVTVTVADR